ncbi:DUF6192 family protein [Streptomyces sp. NPDC050610]|uniref:DUF6192 family protein n=1 Tax=Streptomyces sp. NPDC050610 TaxID=3157097 RepID=UPI003419F54C
MTARALCEWSGDAAKRLAGWATAAPVTIEEKAGTILDLAQDDTVAAQAACDLLHHPEIAFRALRDSRVRELVKQAQFDLAKVEGEGFEDDFDTYPEEDEEDVEDPVRIVLSFHRSMDFTDLVGVCQGFVAGSSRPVPRLRGQELTEAQLSLILRHLEKIRATADWIETAVSTGKVDLDETLAQLVRGQ